MYYRLGILSLLLSASGIYAQEKEPDDKPKEARTRSMKGLFGRGQKPSYGHKKAAAVLGEEPVVVCSVCRRSPPQEHEKAHRLHELCCLACKRLNYEDRSVHPIYRMPRPESNESTSPE